MNNLGVKPIIGALVGVGLVVGKTKSLSEPQNAVIRSALERVLEVRFAGSRKNAAASLGVAPAFLSDVLRKKRGAGVRLVFGLARYAPEAVLRAMALEWKRLPLASVGLPNLREAMARCEKMSAATLAYGAHLADHWRVDREVGEWLAMLFAFNEAHT